MTTTTTGPGLVLTRTERDLIVRVVRRARQLGWRWHYGYPTAPDGTQLDWWSYEATGRRPARVIVYRNGCCSSAGTSTVEVHNVQQVVDVLVALGVLPADLSAVYWQAPRDLAASVGLACTTQARCPVHPASRGPHPIDAARR